MPRLFLMLLALLLRPKNTGECGEASSHHLVIDMVILLETDVVSVDVE